MTQKWPKMSKNDPKIAKHVKKWTKNERKQFQAKILIAPFTPAPLVSLRGNMLVKPDRCRSILRLNFIIDSFQSETSILKHQVQYWKEINSRLLKLRIEILKIYNIVAQYRNWTSILDLALQYWSRIFNLQLQYWSRELQNWKMSIFDFQCRKLKYWEFQYTCSMMKFNFNIEAA